MTPNHLLARRNDALRHEGGHIAFRKTAFREDGSGVMAVSRCKTDNPPLRDPSPPPEAAA